MKPGLLALAFLFSTAICAADSDEVLDTLGEQLSYSGFHNEVRARLSGTLDLEEYSYTEPAPGLIYSPHSSLFNPRLTVYLDTQIGSSLYGFVQVRADHGFDPTKGTADVRLDEYAVRYTPWDDGRFHLQVGKFSAVIGNWIRRHGSWDDSFVTAPLPYEQPTGFWDSEGVPNAATLLQWSHLRPNPHVPYEYADKNLRIPIIWGPAYAEGVSVSGRAGWLEFAAEMKGAAISSRPYDWELSQSDFRHPTFNAEVSLHPGPTWNLGVFASHGTYLRPGAEDFETREVYDRGKYHQTVVGADFEYAWHHFQLWAEIFHSSFQDPAFGHASVTSYYVETKYQFSPQWFGALRWNQQLYGDVFDPAEGRVKWGRDTWRIDLGPTYRFTRHTQIKAQYSFQHGYSSEHANGHLLALQLTLKF